MKAPSPSIRACRRCKDIFTNHHLINESMNHRGVCRAPLASPGSAKNCLTPTKYRKVQHTEDNFHEVQKTKCTKTLY